MNLFILNINFFIYCFLKFRLLSTTQLKYEREGGRERGIGRGREGEKGRGKRR